MYYKGYESVEEREDGALDNWKELLDASYVDMIYSYEQFFIQVPQDLRVLEDCRKSCALRKEIVDALGAIA